MVFTWLVPVLSSPDVGLFWLVPVITFLMIIKVLEIFNMPDKPRLFYKGSPSKFVLSVLDMCPILRNVYRPTFLWGKSGHFQTIVHVKMGRTKPHFPDSERFHMLMPDGATMSYDLFDPHEEDGHRAKFTLALCPGIANSSECIYLRTFASSAQTHGFRVAILNHLGALKSEVLTSPRIFTYGGTEEYGRMIDHLLEKFPDTKILAVGFSMGGNIITKYLGENLDNQKKVLCGMSVCQGYEINEAKVLFLEWSNLRRLYTYLMTLNIRRLLSRHRQLLFSPEAQQQYGEFREKTVFGATSLDTIDDNYSCIRAGFKTVFEYYRNHSSAYLLKNIHIPMLFMNAEDDPICPPPLLKYPREFAENNENCIFMTTKHGGHLGYFEGGVVIPENVTWLDRVIIEYADAIANLYLHGNLPKQTGTQASLLSSMTENYRKDRDTDNINASGDSGDSGTDDIDRGISTSVEGAGCLHHETQGLRKRETGKAESSEEPKEKEEEKRGSLKRGSLLQQATSFVQ